MYLSATRFKFFKLQEVAVSSSPKFKINIPSIIPLPSVPFPLPRSPAIPADRPCTAKPTQTSRPQTRRRSIIPSPNTSRRSRNSGARPLPRRSSNTRPPVMATNPGSPAPAALAALAAQEDPAPAERQATCTRPSTAS
jgi:hypothetical protein